MILYVNGDSHSAGHDAGGVEFSYGRHLATALTSKFVCDAKAGGSNARIIRTTNIYLENNTPDCVVIGWSTQEREEWFYKGKYYDVNGSGSDVLPIELDQRYKTWVIEYAHNYADHDRESHKLIWDFHLSLIERNIPHLFFNCYSYFTHVEIKYDWGSNYIDPYSKESTYYFWLESKGYQPSNPKYYHYGPDAHIAWADFLLPHLTKVINDSIITS